MKRVSTRRRGLVAMGLLAALTWCAAVGSGAVPPADAAEATADGLPVYLFERYYSAPQSQKVDPPVRVGDILRFRWIGDAKPPTSVVEIVARDDGKTLAELGWEVYSQPKDDPSSAFSLIPLRPGSLELPEMSVLDHSRRAVGVTRAQKFEVEPAASPEELQKKAPDFLPPMAMKLPWGWVGALLIGGLLLAAVALAVIWKVSRRMRRRPAEAVVEIPRARLPECEEALQALDRIEKARSWAEGRYKPHYFGTSETLKRYIERRYGFDAAESTTREMLAVLAERGLDQPRIQLLSSLFEMLDRVKFTDFTPDDGECSRVIDEARGWIRATRQAAPRLGGSDAV